MPEGFQDLDLKTETIENDEEGQSEDTYRRNLATEIDLLSFLNFEVIRGSDDAAFADRINFSVAMKEFTEYSVVLQVSFENPLSLSTGKWPDIFRCTLVQPALFIAKASGKTIPLGTVIEKEIPR